MSERYTLPYGGREIYRDGKPFVILTRHPIPDAQGDDVGLYGATPVECDDFGRAIVEALNRPTPVVGITTSGGCLDQIRGSSESIKVLFVDLDNIDDEDTTGAERRTLRQDYATIRKLPEQLL